MSVQDAGEDVGKKRLEYEPDSGAVTKREKLESLVYQACGTASLCWNPKPTGIFDSSTAKEVGDALIRALEKLDREYRYPAEDLE